MKIVSINTFNIGSTGKIMLQLADEARKEGLEYFTCCPRARDNYKKQVEHQIFIGNRALRNVHGILSKITGMEGLFSIASTANFLRRIDSIKPNIVHLHNIHGSYINYPLLFWYIKKNHIRVLWTLHDCWPFTGRCPHFITAKCEKWKNKCYSCTYPKSEYPSAKLDTSKINYSIKKRVFCNVDDLTIITPSEWLAGLVKESFLKEYSVRVINNGIDLNVFKPYKNSFRDNYSIKKKQIMLLGVAFNWDYRKGIDVFIKLAERLDDNYVIVIVGTNEETERKLPDNIIAIRRTENQRQLAEIYSAADIFINPTREDNYPTVNMEAIACGTPVITFRTGGSPEMIDDGCGKVVDVDDVDGLVNNIKDIKTWDIEVTKNRCCENALRFASYRSIQKYIMLYKNVNQEDRIE